MRDKMEFMRRVLAMASFCLWFGGFTFYASVVIPVGEEVLGSATTQGFVTQRVTNSLNIIGGLTLVFSWWEALASARLGWRRAAVRFDLVILTVTWGALVVLHPRLDELLATSGFIVEEPERFYELHRLYLIGSVTQWIGQCAWLLFVVEGWSPRLQRAA